VHLLSIGHHLSLSCVPQLALAALALKNQCGVPICPSFFVHFFVNIC
jgi:hypothetical protein